jgi:aminoglycoside phosphotransferase family enzyme/predicted kinase
MNAAKPHLDDDRTQQAVFAFLDEPSTYGGGEVRRCDTHAAAVFLAGDRALKVKRAVRFPFLDYSTLAKRKAACAAELDVNRRFAPRLYRRIVAITREPDSRLALDGHGEPVEWAVEMTRFDENQTLDHIADRGTFGDTLPAKLARMTAAMHGSAEHVDTEPWLKALEDYIGQNTAAFRKDDPLFPGQMVTRLDRESRAALERIRPLLATRGQQGLTRRCHGDLHLGNIALIDGDPLAFDAIEFDPIIASGDVLYDLAFLLMDLVERDLVWAANGVLNGYLAAARRTEDCDGLTALFFFMSLRAAIRAKVTAARLDQAAEQDRDGISRSAARYFQLALDLLAPVPPSVICTGGLSGTGKSLLARSLAPLVAPIPGAVVLRSDVERKALFGKSETEHLPPEAYRPEVTAKLYAALTDQACRIARAGLSVIVDAVFAKPSERAAIEVSARHAGAAFHGLFLTADLATRIQRIGGRGPDASDADAAVARRQEDYAVGTMNWDIVDASDSPAQTLAKARAVLD